jgi:hypothetical protein
LVVVGTGVVIVTVVDTGAVVAVVFYLVLVVLVVGVVYLGVLVVVVGYGFLNIVELANKLELPNKLLLLYVLLLSLFPNIVVGFTYAYLLLFKFIPKFNCFLLSFYNDFYFYFYFYYTFCYYFLVLLPKMPNPPLPNIVPYFLLSVIGLLAVLMVGFVYFLLYSALLLNELNNVPFFYELTDGLFSFALFSVF